ncbi:heat shock factor-binding protein 1-like protein 1 isoform X2 [Pyrgilauda ruficollis]|uniref:heat shock factor-binding protein 1-like protein 1 isoform X2 n=1 Tax=Pyrgilauda ruficollis TaxID=221976 RepID=UPI001B872A4E|nr:heat shock factor-binding protein 1-like protein 1 isoform X2 [Pyrgilauda ruficollis]
MAAAEPPGAAELPRLAENLLCRLQENFEALTEKLTLRNILFGTWGSSRGWGPLRAGYLYVSTFKEFLRKKTISHTVHSLGFSFAGFAPSPQ